MVEKRNSKWAAALGLGIAAGVSYATRVRPWLLNWGATWGESDSFLPGDEFAPECRYRATRAITVDASIDRVWQWLVQIGQDRGGFYSYSWLENLFFADMHNANEIIPEFQERKIGDTVWLANPKRYGGRGRMIVVALEPYEDMALVMPSDAERIANGDYAVFGCWSFHVRQIGDTKTRLLVRSRSGNFNSIPQMLFDFLIFDPAHFMMERKMLLGIKERAERAS